jgi:dihydrofolate reductase
VVAGEKNVMLIGASINQQCLNAKLCDELHIGIMPILFGGGLRFFENIDFDAIALEKMKIYEAGERTDIWYRVKR